MSLDIKFDANDLIADYTLAVTNADKAKIIKQYHEEVGIITNFLTDMPSNIRDAYNDLSGK